MLSSQSPWDGQPVWSSESASPASAATAVAAAAAAAPAWAEADRSTALRRLGRAVADHRTAIETLLVREAGKTAEDAATEAGLLAKKIDVTLGEGQARTPGVPAFGSAVSLAWRPRGVAVCIGPSNFPLHLLHGLVVPALAVGCTVVAKPSERTPALGELYRALLNEAGLIGPAQVVLGGAEIAAALVDHPQTATVAAVGSRATGVALSQRLAGRPEVVLALELGGVNHVLLCADADLAAAVPVLADGAWRMAGQRCTATRIVHVPRAGLADLVARLTAERARWVPSGTPSGPMGPMTAAALRDRFLAAWTARPAGLDLIAGAAVPPIPAGAFAEPLIAVVRDPAARGHTLVADEHFGPAVIIDPYDDESEAAARMAANPHRLSAAVWTTDRDRFLRLCRRLPYGLVAHNRSTAGARADLPFGGCGQSGNGRPAAVAAGQIFADETVVW
jgi:succinylglutamic semialdehyde dehydrogenase